jgi:phospholipid transport system substrate-binding protein
MNIIGYPIRVLSATVVFIAILTSSTVSGRAVSCPAANIVSNAGNALIGAAHNSSAPAFAAVLARYVDGNAIAMSALGQYRGALPQAQRAEYLANTKRFISRFLVEKSGAFKNSQKLTIDSCDGNLVKTSFEGRSRVVWRLSGGRIADVQVSGVWLALQLRSKFTSIVRRNNGDVSALLDFLRG